MARSTLITIEQVEEARRIIKEFERQEASQLPYILGTVRIGSGWNHAQKDRATGKILRRFYDITRGRNHYFEVFEEEIIQSFKEYD